MLLCTFLLHPLSDTHPVLMTKRGLLVPRPAATLAILSAT